jgi:hypothetical protein
MTTKIINNKRNSRDKLIRLSAGSYIQLCAKNVEQIIGGNLSYH